ncbi:MAG TPA: rhodanese-like domain-containing protein [Blastocatellia bacterium]|nr:rhodanese-like domain-containing protein [Blastocatellia bacterium]
MKGERTIESSVSELRAQILSGASCSIIDVREGAEYASGRIAGSRLIPLGEIERRASEIDRAQPVYVVCRSGRRSAEAQRRLIALGFRDVRNVAGGMIAWEAAPLPVERDERAPWSLERQVRVAAGSLVVLGVLLSALVAPEFIWLAGFVGAGLVFAGITDTCAMGIMLARMPWNRSAHQNAACSVE